MKINVKIKTKIRSPGGDGARPPRLKWKASIRGLAEGLPHLLRSAITLTSDTGSVNPTS